MVVCLPLAGCPGDEGNKTDVTETLAIKQCVESIRLAEKIAPRERIAQVAEGCSAACPALKNFAKAYRSGTGSAHTPLLDSCDLACSDKARRAFERANIDERATALYQHCGDRFYGIVAGRSELLSQEWFVLNRINLWLQQAAQRNRDPVLRHGVEEATALTHFPLTLPARSAHYRLPTSRHGQRETPTFFVVVTADSIYAAAIPVTRLRGPELELRPVPGGAFPGTELRKKDPRAHLAELEKMLAAIHGNNTVGMRVLYLADEKLPAKRLVDASALLDHRRLSIAVRGDVALTHEVELQRLSALGSAAPALTLTAASLPLPAKLDTTIGRQKLVNDLAFELTQRAPSGVVEVRLDATSTVADLVAAADVIRDAGGDTAVLSY
jgi:hypothetical protein